MQLTSYENITKENILFYEAKDLQSQRFEI